MTSRRGFFGAFAGVAAAAVGVRTATATPAVPDATRELQEVSAAFARLRTEMEKPINITMVLDGRAVAEHSVRLIPTMLRQQGLR